MKELIARIDELYANATGGDWAIRAERYRFVHVYSSHGGIAHMDTVDVEGTSTAKLIAALHNSWPQIRDALEKMSADAERWQPIETAPKDGACILVGNKYGSWIAKYLPVYQSGFRPENPWASMMLNHDHMGEKRHPPTHWQPLTAAPAIDEAKK